VIRKGKEKDSEWCRKQAISKKKNRGKRGRRRGHDNMIRPLKKGRSQEEGLSVTRVGERDDAKKGKGLSLPPKT